MNEVEWVYKYIFKSEKFKIAKIKSNAEQQRKEYKLPRIIIEYRIGHIWHQIGFF